MSSFCVVREQKDVNLLVSACITGEQLASAAAAAEGVVVVLVFPLIARRGYAPACER